jgi:hypothetical protein
LLPLFSTSVVVVVSVVPPGVEVVVFFVADEESVQPIALTKTKLSTNVALRNRFITHSLISWHENALDLAAEVHLSTRSTFHADGSPV